MPDYDRAAAVAYAHRWAYARNPDYGVFDEIGGDCANFVSQCLYAGCRTMNTSVGGWYYHSMNDRSPSWTGVYFQYQFLIGNRGAGPYGEVRPLDDAQPGDVFQMAFVEGLFTHSGIVVAVEGSGASGIKVAAHTIDCDDRPLDTYAYQAARIIHILGARR